VNVKCRSSNLLAAKVKNVEMLNMCSGHADQLDIQFNTKKSRLLHIGNSFNKKIENLQLNGQDILV